MPTSLHSLAQSSIVSYEWPTPDQIRKGESKVSRTIDDVRRVLQAQPFSKLLQADIIHYAPDRVELRVPLTEAVKQQHGFAHGGVVSYVADNALTFAGGAALGPAVVTSEFKINYVRPAVGNFLSGRAAVVHAGKTQAVCRCEIYAVTDSGEKLCAVAQGTIVLMGRDTNTTPSF